MRRYLTTVLLFAVVGLGAVSGQAIQPLGQLIGKEVIVRGTLCKPGTRKFLLAAEGKTGTVVALRESEVKGKEPRAVLVIEVSLSGDDRITPLETCGPVTVRSLSLFVELVPDQKLGQRKPATVATPSEIAPVLNSAQNSQVILEPEFRDVFFRLDAGKLIPLERQLVAVQGSSSTALVGADIKHVFTFEGGKSPVHFLPSEKLEFVVRTSLPTDVDPNTTYCLRRLDARKDKRELQLAAGYVGFWGSSVKTTPSQGILPLNFSRYASSSLKLTPATALPTGQYALSNFSDRIVFCFGVDYPGPTVKPTKK